MRKIASLLAAAAAAAILLCSVLAIEARSQILGIIPAGAHLVPGSVTQYRCFYTGAGPVTWSISPPAGSMSPAGLYTAPQPLVAPLTITVTCATPGYSSATSAFLTTGAAAPPFQFDPKSFCIDATTTPPTVRLAADCAPPPPPASAELQAAYILDGAGNPVAIGFVPCGWPATVDLIDPDRCTCLSIAAVAAIQAGRQ